MTDVRARAAHVKTDYWRPSVVAIVAQRSARGERETDHTTAGPLKMVVAAKLSPALILRPLHET